MRQQLENLIDLYKPMVSEQRQRTYFVVSDLEFLSATALYTGKFLGPFRKGSYGNIFTNYDLGELTDDKSLSGWNLQERFDFKNPLDPHINYGITSPKGGYLKNLGDAHKIDLDF